MSGMLLQVLEIKQPKQTWYIDIYKTVMWNIAKGILWLLDGIFDVINKIWRYKFFENEYVNNIFNGALIVACSWLVLKVILELVMNHIVNNDGKSNPLSVYRGIVLAIVMMFLIPSLFTFGHKLSTELTNSVISISKIEQSKTAESTISKAIISAMIYENEMKEEDKTNLVLNWKTININATEGGVMGFGDRYKYSLNFFMLIILSIVVMFLLFFIAIQMAKRVMEIALAKIIGVFCCTGLTNNRSKTFEVWGKHTMGLFLITVVQFVSIGLLLNMFSSAFKENGVLAGIFLIIGALLFIISTPSFVSSLLGQQLGLMTALGDMQSMVAMGNGITSGLSFTKSGAMGSLSLGANVVKGGSHLVTKGVGKISNMLDRGKILKEDQMGAVKDSLLQHKPYQATQQIKNFMNEKSQGKYGNITVPNGSNLFNNIKYNPIRNQYMSQANLDKHKNFDRKDY